MKKIICIICAMLFCCNISGCSEKQQTSVLENETQKIHKDNKEEKVVFSYNSEDGGFSDKKGKCENDWDNDNEMDSITVKVLDEEGAEYIEQLRLNLSSSSEKIVMKDLLCGLVDIVGCNLDEDEDREIVLVFDMHYAGANGSCGIIVLDKRDDLYIPLMSEPFTGNEQEVDGAIAGMYQVEILETDDGKNRIRTVQYVSGESLIEHIGDIESVYKVHEGMLKCDSSVMKEIMD